MRRRGRIVRERYNSSPPAKTRPLKIPLKKSASEVGCKPSRYPPEIRPSPRSYTSQLKNLRLIKPSTKKKWESAQLVVPKTSSALYRMTVDYWPLSRETVRNTWAMSNLATVIDNVHGVGAFAMIDFTTGYWQFPMDSECQDLHGFKTTDGVMHPTSTT